MLDFRGYFAVYGMRGDEMGGKKNGKDGRDEEGEMNWVWLDLAVYVWDSLTPMMYRIWTCMAA